MISADLRKWLFPEGVNIEKAKLVRTSLGLYVHLFLSLLHLFDFHFKCHLVPCWQSMEIYLSFLLVQFSVRLSQKPTTFLILQTVACHFLYAIFLYKHSHTLVFQHKAKDWEDNSILSVWVKKMKWHQKHLYTVLVLNREQSASPLRGNTASSFFILSVH